MPIAVETLTTHEASDHALETVRIPMTALDRTRVRRLVTAPDGAELALALPTGTRLIPGQVLARVDGKVYVVEAAPEDLLLIRPNDWKQAAYAAHFIGNLHRDIDIQKDGRAALYDPGLEEKPGRAGLVCERVTRPYGGRPAGTHSH